MNFKIEPIHDAALASRIQARLDSLTKPRGSLGRLETLAMQLGLIQKTDMPLVNSQRMVIFGADHGVVEEGVSPFPQAVTQQMMMNFREGGAAINVLCRHYGIDPVIVDVGVGRGTKNFTREPAMSREEASRAIEVGRSHADADLLGAGEMGIGNTTSAAALLSAMEGIDPTETAGRGTGLDDAGVARKVDAIRRGLALHRTSPEDPIGVLAAFGGFEIAAIVGLILGAAERRKIVMLDGFISCSAALIAKAVCPASIDYVVFSHCSAERAHRMMLEFLGARPLFDLDMRLGEGSAAAIAMDLVAASLKLYREMATFSAAGVSEA